MVKSVNVLDAIQWIKAAVGEVLPTTVQRCFEKAGINTELDPAVCPLEDDLPLAELLCTAAEELQLAEPLTADGYADIDSDAPATEQLPDGWERELIRDFDFIAEKNGEVSEGEVDDANGQN